MEKKMGSRPKKERPMVKEVFLKPSFLAPSIAIAIKIRTKEGTGEHVTHFSVKREIAVNTKVGDLTTYHLKPFGVKPKQEVIDGVLYLPVKLSEFNWVLRAEGVE